MNSTTNSPRHINNHQSFTLAAFLFIMAIQTTSAQLAAGFYAGSNGTKVAIGYDITPKLWADLRMFGGVSLSKFTPELSINYNFVRREIHDIYVGASLSVNGRNNLIIPFGFRVKPFEKMRELKLIVEAEPLYNFHAEDLEFVCIFGMRYTFNNKKE